MSSNRIIEKLKDRWGVHSAWQVGVIFVVFAITGMSSVMLKKPVFAFLGLDWDKNKFTYVLAYVFVFFPLYQVLFLGYSFLFGQSAFAMRFMRRMFGRLLPFLKQGND